MHYSLLEYILTNNEVQFTSKFFARLSIMVGVKHLTTAAYHPQMTEQVELYNHMTVTRLRHYAARNQKDCSIYVQAWTYA